MTATNGFVKGSRTGSYASPPFWSFGFGGSSDSDGAWFSRYDIALMMRDPRVRIGLRMLYAPVATATYSVECDDDDAGEFITRTVDKFWKGADLMRCLSGMLGWGSLGGELVMDFDEYAGSNGQWEFSHLKDFHLDDTQPLRMPGSGNLCGVRVNGLSRDGNYVPQEQSHPQAPTSYIDLMYPGGFWVANEPRHSSFYGQSRLSGAWKPWKEKRGKHGAIDVRKAWMIRSAFRGAQMRYPEGFSPDANGRMVPNQDLAREILEQYLAGNVLAMNSAWDQMANAYAWQWVDAKMGEDNSSILKYSDVLDREILEGMEIPPEALEAPEVGSGWSGRSIPMLQFLASEDIIVLTALGAFCRQGVRPLVAVNYGPHVRWRVVPNSLLPKSMPGGTSVPAGVPPQPSVPQGDMTQQPKEVAQPPEMGLSHDSVADVVAGAVGRFFKKVS